MLSLKYLRPDPFQEMCNVQCSEKDSGKKLSLQARVIRWIFHKRKRASCFGSCRASVTVEASLVFPIFLCAVACFIGLAQMILVETEVHYAVSQTAKICAKQQMFSLIPEEDDQKSNQVKEDNGIHKSDRTNGRQSIRNASSVFFDIYDAKSLCDSLVEGGRKGISVQSAFSSEEEVQVKAIYTLKLSVPFFRPIRFQKDTAVKRRVFSGYVIHRRDSVEDGDNPGKQLELTIEVSSINAAYRWEGARIQKYEYELGMTGNMNNDFVLYRLADIYYMKAEAILRGGNAATLSALCAEPAFQLIRERANQPVYTPETLTLDELINERGREFAWEGWRRQDLVRWDKFAKGSWTFKEALNNNSRDLFPIPYDQITKNQSWKQNPGY